MQLENEPGTMLGGGSCTAQLLGSVSWQLLWPGMLKSKQADMRAGNAGRPSASNRFGSAHQSTLMGACLAQFCGRAGRRTASEQAKPYTAHGTPQQRSTSLTGLASTLQQERAVGGRCVGCGRKETQPAA